MKMWKAKALFIMFIVFSRSTSFAQEPKRMRMAAPPSGGYRMLTEDGKTIIPFEFISNHVVIPVSINGNTLKFILDTGMPTDGAVLFGSKRVNTLGLQIIGKAQVMGAGGGSVESDLSMGVTFGLPGVEFTNQMVIVMPEDSTQSRHFEGKDGIIGHTLFSRFVVRIDYDNMNIILAEPDRFEYTGTGQVLPLQMGRYPFLVCEADIKGGQRIPLSLVVDTGNGAALTLNVGAKEGLVIPEKVIEYHTRSIGPEILRLTGRIERLQLGSYMFKNLLCSFRTSAHEPAPPWAKEGVLGQGILRRFNIVFDYTHEKIILEPNGHFNESFEFNMAGIQFNRAAQDRFQISRVIPDSPASEAGLCAGDLIVQMNGRPVSQFSVDDVEQLLKKEGEKLMLDIKRGKELLQLSLILRRLI